MISKVGAPGTKSASVQWFNVRIGDGNDANFSPGFRRMKLKEITAGLSLSGVEPTQIVSVVATVSLGDGALQLIYRTPDGAMKERLLASADEESISVATVERPFSFDGDGAAFQLACEAKRIDLAFLFDPMMAVHTSNVEPLPHQITAVYESMLPRQPLRFLLADDPGAGKTIMAGLYIRELIMRADARRILIVAPGSLVEQWRDEMFEKFGLEFSIYSALLEQAAPSGNPFDNHHQLIVRLDQFSRNEEMQEKLCAAGWDLAVFDEAHKLAAHYFGSKLEKTARFRFAEKLGTQVRHLLLMTATPHSGKEEDYQLFLSLLDSDRFYGKFRDGVHKVDASDLMRRMVKEDLLKFDGTPLFPERKAYTVNYTLSNLEAALYDCATHYVQAEMGKADALQGPRKGSVGFALTALQRRLASSPEAIYQSLKRRKERLEGRLRDEKLGLKGRQALDRDHLKSLLDRNALAQETMSAERIFAVKEEMEKAEARRLQPYFVRAFFLRALDALGRMAHAREAGRYEIAHVPVAIRERDHRITGRNRREQEPVLKRYDRICFERTAIQPLEKAGLSRAVLMHPGHPLMLSMSDMILEQHANLLRQGAILVDPADEGTEPWLLFLLTHEVKSGDGLVLSKRLQFVRVGADGEAKFAGWAPHLDLEPLPGSEQTLLKDVPWVATNQEGRAVALAAATLVPEHYNEVASRRIAHVEKTLAAVHERLTRKSIFGRTAG